MLQEIYVTIKSSNHWFLFGFNNWWLLESPDSTIHKAAGLMVPGHSMIWLVQFLKICEAMNRRMVSEGHSSKQHFLLFCREWLVTKELRALWIVLFQIFRSWQGPMNQTFFLNKCNLSCGDLSQCLVGSGCSKDQEIHDWTTAGLISTLFINCHYDCTQFAQWLSPNI